MLKIRLTFFILSWLLTAGLPGFALAAETIYDDLVVAGSLGVGTDMTSTYSFGFDTLVMRENNLRLFFDDTSVSGFPNNDWRISINSSVAGGGSFFSIDDATANNSPFKIDAGAGAQAFHIHSTGRIGFGTAAPAMELHMLDSDTPTVRLEQDNSIWGAQTWDVGANEANFFIRDVSHGSVLPFRIQPGSPSNALTVRADGNVGMGTWAPSAPLEVQTSTKDAVLLVHRTDGADATLAATDTMVSVGSRSGHPLELVVNGTAAMTIDTAGQVGVGTATPAEALHVVGNAYVSGNLELGCSRDLKENIAPVGAAEARAALDGLAPVKYNYKSDPTEQSLGFIAEEVPDLVAVNSRKRLSPMDVTAVLVKVVQEQQRTIEMLSRRVAQLEQALVPASSAAHTDAPQKAAQGGI